MILYNNVHIIRTTVLILVVVLQYSASTAMAVVNADERREHINYDSIFVKDTGDSIRAPFFRMLSLHTNAVDWFLATPNATLEIDLSPYHRTRYSVLLTGKVNPATRSHTINPRWVYNVTSIKGEFRRYWRTGSIETAWDLENVRLDSVERDTTLWGPLSRWSYFRRKYLSGHYKKHPRPWRAYYLGFYGAYNKFSLSIEGKGKQGSAMSLGLSAGWSIPLYKHLDGSGWDLDIGASAGVMMPKYDEYEYNRESGCYAFTKKVDGKPTLMPQELRISLAYRFRSIDSKAMYGSKRFALREEKRKARMEARIDKTAKKLAEADSTLRYTDFNVLMDKSKEQLALYTDTTAYYYEVLRHAIEYVNNNSEELKYDSDWIFKREVLMHYLQYYMTITNEMVPEELRTDREERAVARQKQGRQAEKERQLMEKEAEKRHKKEDKQAKAAEKEARKAEAAEKKQQGNENAGEEVKSAVEDETSDTGEETSDETGTVRENVEAEEPDSEPAEHSEDSSTPQAEEGGEE